MPKQHSPRRAPKNKKKTKLNFGEFFSILFSVFVIIPCIFNMRNFKL